MKIDYLHRLYHHIWEQTRCFRIDETFNFTSRRTLLHTLALPVNIIIKYSARNYNAQIPTDVITCSRIPCDHARPETFSKHGFGYIHIYIYINVCV